MYISMRETRAPKSSLSWGASEGELAWAGADIVAVCVVVHTAR
jgi:hypothetical protein